MQYGFYDALQLFGSLGLFLFGMKVMSDALMNLAGDKMRSILARMTSNRFLGIFTGFTITSIIQSSSATTLMVVSFANASLLTLTESISVIMGANIGTTITNTIVSLGHIKQGEEFKRAFSAATIHDFFNLLCVIIFLPLEIAFGFLEKIGAYFSTILVGGDSVSMSGLNFM